MISGKPCFLSHRVFASIFSHLPTLNVTLLPESNLRMNCKLPSVETKRSICCKTRTRLDSDRKEGRESQVGPGQTLLYDPNETTSSSGFDLNDKI